MINYNYIYNINCNNCSHWIIAKFGFVSLTFDNDKTCFLTNSFFVLCYDDCDNKKFKHFSHE